MTKYGELARVWMSANGSNSEEFQRRDFASTSLEALADDCIKSWDEPDLDRDALIEALAEYKSELLRPKFQRLMMGDQLARDRKARWR